MTLAEFIKYMNAVCRICGGTGRRPGFPYLVCPACLGSGVEEPRGDDLTLAEFIAARLGEDEAAAKATVPPHTWRPEQLDDTGVFAADQEHIARHDPARVLRQVAAMRAILAAWQESLAIQDGYREVSYEEGRREAQETTCRALAAIWADHPDYDAEWKPAL